MLTLDRFLSYIQGSQLCSNPRNLSEQHSHLLQWNTRPEYVLIDTISDIGNNQTHRIVGYRCADVECHTFVCEGKNAGLVRIRSTKNIELIKSYTKIFCLIWMVLENLKKGL